MIDPIISIAVTIVIILVAIILFRPDSTFLNRWRQLRLDSQRVYMEDALKHVYECETNKVSCTIQSIGGAIDLSADKATSIMTRLESSNLVKFTDGTFKLTRQGRDYALKIIRLHRLYERYLAEETGLPESKWHKEADFHEHKMTTEQAEKISRKLGNPLFDPHGDPIPTSGGEVPKEVGTSLADLPVGKHALVSHLEDEPYAIYDKLIQNGFHLGTQIQITQISENNYHVIADGQEKIVTQLEARNINVSPIEEDQTINFGDTTLDTLNTGQHGEIIAISRACHGQQRRRLMDLGVLPGTDISVEMKSLGGDPIAYFIRGTTIALRKDQAKMIYVKPISEN